jgi:hypothetical protein
MTAFSDERAAGRPGVPDEPGRQIDEEEARVLWVSVRRIYRMMEQHLQITGMVSASLMTELRNVLARSAR